MATTGKNKANILPIIDWLGKYQKKWLKGDLMAGLTMGVMLIPQGMAYAMIAGLPPVYGLYTALVPIVLYALFGTARQLAVGPVAMDSLFVAATISTLSAAGEERYIELVLLLTCMVGLLQLIFGVLRLGVLVNFLSKPIITGFTSAAAIIIAANQLKHLFRIPIARNNQLHLLFNDIVHEITKTHFLTFVLGVVAIGLIFFIKKINKKIPVALILVVLGILLTTYFQWAEKGVQVVGHIPKGLPQFKVPHFSWEDIRLLLPASFALALIGFMEAIAIGKAMEEKTELYKIRPNQELIALGISNAVGAFFSAYVVTGGFSRSAVNEDAGAKTGLSLIVSAVVILLTVLFLTDLFQALPKVVLAAIIFSAVIRLIDFKAPIAFFKADKNEFLMYSATLLATLFIGVTAGIVIGVLLSIVLLIYKVTVPHMAVIGRIPNSHVFKNKKRFPNAEISDELLIVRFDARLFYANVNYFRDKLVEFEAVKPHLKTIIIDASGINSIDLTALQELRKMKVSYKKRGVTLVFAGLKGPVRDVFKQHRFYTNQKESNCFLTVDEAVRCFEGEKMERNLDVTLQSNWSAD